MIGSYLEELTTLENMQPKDRLEQDLIFLKNIFKKIILHHFFFFFKGEKNPQTFIPLPSLFALDSSKKWFNSTTFQNSTKFLTPWSTYQSVISGMQASSFPDLVLHTNVYSNTSYQGNYQCIIL